MINLEGRLVRVELLLRKLLRNIQSILGRLDTLEQLSRLANGVAYNWGGGGGGGQTYFAQTPSSGSWGATGTFPSMTPGSFTADVYRSTSGSLTLVASGATCYCYYPSSPGTSKIITLGSNGDATYSVLAESCT